MYFWRWTTIKESDGLNYIILDLEWNQPIGRGGMITEPVPLNGEIIRIGAVRTNDACELVDSFQICVRPKFYKRINRAVEKVTGLDSAALSFGRPFAAAYQSFLRFCGDDPVFITWGTEDEKVLRANLAVHGMDDSALPPFYDLQVIFSHRVTHDSRQYGVSAAVEHYGLPLDLKAHDALNDATYTYRIAREMGLARYIPAEYDKVLAEVEEERRIQRELRFYRTYTGIESVEAGIRSKKIITCRCPECKTKLRRTYFVFISERKAIAFAECPEDGEYLVTIKFSQVPNGTFDVTRSFTVPSPQQRAEYREVIDRYVEEIKAKKQAEQSEQEDDPLKI